MINQPLNGLAKELASVLNILPEFGLANHDVHEDIDSLAHEQGLKIWNTD